MKKIYIAPQAKAYQITGRANVMLGTSETEATTSDGKLEMETKEQKSGINIWGEE